MRQFFVSFFALLALAACSAPAQQVDPTNTPTPFQPVEPTRTASPNPATPTSTATLSATPIPRTTLLFTGVIVPARCVQAAIDESGDPDYPYEAVRDIIQEADLAIGTLNATISDFPPKTGCGPTFVLVGDSRNADALANAGFDAMSVATNHIKNCGPSNCGDRAFFDTLENLERVGIEYVGAGDNLEEAEQPIVLTANGIRFGIVSLGQLEELAFAGEDTPGIAVLTEESLTAAIKAVQSFSDVVIAMPHWGPETSPNPNASQQKLAQVAVDAGADVVVGNHTHVVQAIEEIEGIPVFYGLGNFVFDQTWSRETQQAVILILTFEGTEFVEYELIPTHVDGEGHVTIADEDEAAEILDRIELASQRLPSR
ncbi:MAG: CapA family protein [Chloroflexi bacterium]|nr:MAG: CapA family protein [Chloroflexota bacterium]MBL1196536.1 CapA family protein [Chloroflexota bacterium]NOH13831.1 CapA family protein [Chloroflexota bacterium]